MADALDPFQQEGAEWLAATTSKGRLLADEPGLGKTRQAIFAALMSSSAPPVVICPAGARPVWRREFKQLAPTANPLIIGYNRAHLLDPESLWGRVVILDEAHYLKTPGAGRTADVYGGKTDGVGGLTEHAAAVFALTGTPTPNNPSEIWAMARALFPEAILHPKRKTPMNHGEFTMRYCNVHVDALGYHTVKPGGKRIAELRARLAPYFLRRLKKDVYKDLKDPRHSVLPVEGAVPATEDLDYEQGTLARALAAHGVEGLAALSSHVATLRRLTGMAKVKGAAEWIADFLETSGEKLVVFAYHQDVLRALHNELRDRKIEHVAGGPGSDVLFQESPKIKVYLGQIQRDGVAITLTAAQTCLLVEQSWVPGENDQAWQRIHRRGQTGLCDVRWCALEGSIDEDIAAALAAKAKTIDALWNSAA